jgi:hypothetical protein
MWTISQRRVLLVPFLLILCLLAVWGTGCMTQEAPPDPVDVALAESVEEGAVAYNAPETMRLNETVEIQVLLSKTISGDELEQLLSAEGTYYSDDEVEIADRMKATLQSEDEEAFNIRPLHSNDSQLVGSGRTEWRWSVTARKPRAQKLTLVLERLVWFEEQGEWRFVDSYARDIVVTVTPIEWVVHGGWIWVVLGGVLAGSAIGFWSLRRSRRRPLPGARTFLSPALYQQLRHVLLQCGPFDDEDDLRALFADPRISVWGDDLPGADSAARRVEATIAFLQKRQNRAAENALVLFLQVVQDRVSPDDYCHGQLGAVIQSLTTRNVEAE